MLSHCLFQPQFMHLAQIWTKFQDEMVMLSVLSNLLLNLESFVQVLSGRYSHYLLIKSEMQTLTFQLSASALCKIFSFV